MKRDWNSKVKRENTITTAIAVVLIVIMVVASISFGVYRYSSCKAKDGILVQSTFGYKCVKVVEK